MASQKRGVARAGVQTDTNRRAAAIARIEVRARQLAAVLGTSTEVARDMLLARLRARVGI